MTIEKLRPSFTFTADRLTELAAIVPEAFADGKINWDTLREALGETLEDESQEHFGLFWPGKREARRLAAMPSKGTLVPQPGQGVDEDTTHNIFIEGDNLEVLKLLQKSYAGRVKMIYIDPPYNTGNDFVYPDDYSEPLDAYLKRTEQVDEEGQVLTTNNRTGGRFHSNWLNMIYPRLLLARQLLCDDGSIFVSIDDNEAYHLRQIMNEIFGEENFVACIVWQKRTSPDARSTLGAAHDYILVFAKEIELFKLSFNSLPLDDERRQDYKNPDNDPRGVWASRDLTGQTGHATPSQFYELITPGGIKYRPPDGRCWTMSKSTYEKLVEDNRIWFGKDGTARPRLKLFLSESEGKASWTWWTNKEVGHNQEATKELNDLLGSADIFTNPKPTRLIKRILQLATNSKENNIIVDFFSGSCTTAQAVMDMNREDGGNRNFIMVQLPEPTPIDSAARKKKYSKISDIGQERIRQVSKKLNPKVKGELNLQPNEDLGFRSFTVEHSTFSEWQPYSGKDTSQLELRFDQAEIPLIEGWKPENLLAEILLLQGFPLDSQLRPITEFKANQVLEVSSGFCQHRLYVCLDNQIRAETIAAIKLRPEDILVCLDSALSDEAKITLADRCNLKVI
jgi:adenine-specific DNA-methyltransferase